MSDFDDHRARRSRVAGPAGGGLSPVLRRGDLVAVVAPGFAPPPDVLDRGVTRLRDMGFRVRLGESVGSLSGYFAGGDAARAADLREALDDPETRGVWLARGGYGTARLLDDVGRGKRHPKVVVGFSDATALFAVAARRPGTRCLHGPTVADLATEGNWHEPSLRAALAGREIVWRFPASARWRSGRATGPVVGGNLRVLTHLLGTRHAPRLDGAILFLEDVGEEAYRVDRMLTHLRQARVLDRVAGILLGWFDVPATRRSFPPDVPIEEVLRDRLAGFSGPVVHGFPSGHRPGKWTFPMGGKATIDAAARVVRFGPVR